MLSGAAGIVGERRPAEEQQPADGEAHHAASPSAGLLSADGYLITTVANGSSEIGLGTYPVTFARKAIPGFV